ncbi:xanthine dehydrogenase molybdopterin binding subunit [Candidatus Methylacidiphilum infernorum]|uniref:Xanthine dehydrogenase, molybdopterin-binding subunit B n=1 Tax=Methylacidiphilum infernorum (isolate V4) TaxID=481448 RepID=B3E0E2_METI4|nr:xanthine dehydrogenase molybdopterin binding subunit [Candidatus Methylacidiphilum infernorum]ACD84371.1 Xanthine dehydrogenase, molybdopterin-binding subunit B [Methylacidiphilum infernorum V4]
MKVQEETLAHSSCFPLSLLGQPLTDESALAHVSGRARYTDDYARSFNQLLHAWPVLSPHAHARINGISVENALRIPGVSYVLTAKEIPGKNDTSMGNFDEPLLPTDEVFYHNQPVAWVLGETLEAARLGAAAVSVEYEPLPAIIELEESIASKSWLAGPFRLNRGNFLAAWLESPLRIEGSLRIGGQEHFYLETQAALAWEDANGGILVQSSTQNPSQVQEVIARVLGLPRNRIAVECARMGGAFGGKEVQAAPYAAIAALGSIKTKRPVRVRLPRSLDMVLTGKRHPFLGYFQVGFTPEGKLLALKITLYADGGWSQDLSCGVLWRALLHLDNAYWIPAIEAIGYICRTNKTSQTAFRGFGGPQGVAMIEEVLTRIAHCLNISPSLVRKRNLYRAGQKTPYGQEVREADSLRTLWDLLKKSSHYEERQKKIEEFNQLHPYRKRGIAITPVKFGISFTSSNLNQAGASVMLYRDGSVQIHHGGTEMGQGLHTKIRQIAASLLGLPLESIRVMTTRTDTIPNSSPTAASCSFDLNGAAVAEACYQLRDRLWPLAAKLLDCSQSSVLSQNGRVFSKDNPSHSLSFTELVEEAYRRCIPLFSQGFYRTPGLFFDPSTAQGTPFAYFAIGAAVSEVEIDGFTGEYKLLSVEILHDVGRSINPLIDRGQIEGGFFQGLGWVSCEELIWDQEGKLKTTGASTYKIPSWSELPDHFEVRFFTKAVESPAIGGSKAVGEPPLLLALSVREALKAAITGFGPGPVELGFPATPERVYWAIETVRKRAKSWEKLPVTNRYIPRFS